MYQPVLLQPIDYLVLGHITCDVSTDGYRLGGTATYATLTARALGLRVGVVTSWSRNPYWSVERHPYSKFSRGA